MTHMFMTTCTPPHARTRSCVALRSETSIPRSRTRSRLRNWKPFGLSVRVPAATPSLAGCASRRPRTPSGSRSTGTAPGATLPSVMRGRKRSSSRSVSAGYGTHISTDQGMDQRREAHTNEALHEALGARGRRRAGHRVCEPHAVRRPRERGGLRVVLLGSQCEGREALGCQNEGLTDFWQQQIQLLQRAGGRGSRRVRWGPCGCVPQRFACPGIMGLRRTSVGRSHGARYCAARVRGQHEKFARQEVAKGPEFVAVWRKFPGLGRLQIGVEQLEKGCLVRRHDFAVAGGIADVHGKATGMVRRREAVPVMSELAPQKRIFCWLAAPWVTESRALTRQFASTQQVSRHFRQS